MIIKIDGKTAVTEQNRLWRGMGMVSGNNSSRLLVDYKWEHPDKYWEILNHIFGKNGIGITHLKIEMGSDINSSSGTEPSIMRSEKEKPDITRGAGFILACDAKKINPDLTLDMLWWSEPKWVSDSKNVYEARYKWYKANLTAAYEKYGLIFDYVSCTQNERACDTNWIKYLSKSLKSDKKTPYDFSKIKIVGGEEVCTWRICDQMIKDQELMNSIDVVGSHYTSWSTDNTKYLETFGKEVWFTEGSSPMKYAKGTYRFDEGNNGLSGINGTLDIATRIITSYAKGDMVLYEFQPVISSYYDGVTYCQKQLITANTPWNGEYTLDSGYYMVQHFSNFLPKGWAMIKEGCNGDGKAGGDGHAIINSTYNYLTGTNPKTGDFSTVICNTTENPIKYDFETSNLKSDLLFVWETRGPDSLDQAFNKNYFKKISEITPENGKFQITVKPYSLITVSSLKLENLPAEKETPSPVLELPYEDDFEYSNYDNSYLSERGYAPRYTTDEGGAFEVVTKSKEKNNVLQQKITLENKAKEWGGTPSPVTNLGDDRWFNYSASIDIKLDSKGDEKTYAGIGIRYNLPDAGQNGLWLQVFKNGRWSLNNISKSLASGNIEIKEGQWVNLKVQAVDDRFTAYIDGKILVDDYAKNLKSSVPSSGRVALYSSYNLNEFDNLKIEALENVTPYITRFDDTDFCFTYDDSWTHSLMDSFKCHNRTISSGKEGSVVKLDFKGTGFNLTGLNMEQDTYVQIKIDGKITDEKLKLNFAGNRYILLSKNGLENKEHCAEIKIIEGKFKLDTAEIKD